MSTAPPDLTCCPTRWTLVFRARGNTPEAQTALAALCEAYYPAVERFIRRETTDPQTARDLAHEFFLRILSGGSLVNADPSRGRFRSYLYGAVRHFLSAERAHRMTLKRGGKAEQIPLVQPGTETQATREIADMRAESPEAAFDRHWAMTLLERALDRLAQAMTAEGGGRQFEILKPCLQGGGEPPTRTDMAAAVGMTESALKVAVHRLRRRFRHTVREEIAQTLADQTLVDEEMHHLLEALCPRP